MSAAAVPDPKSTTAEEKPATTIADAKPASTTADAKPAVEKKPTIVGGKTDSVSADKKDGAVEGDTEKSDGADKEADAADKPGSYDPAELEMPEGMLLTEAWVERIKGDEVWQKLTKSEAEQLLVQVSEWDAQRTAQMIEHLNQRSMEWHVQTERAPFVADRGEGGFMAVAREAKAFQAEFFDATKYPEDAEFLEELVTTGLGNHPSLVRVFSKAAVALGLLADGGAAPGAGAPVNREAKKSLAEMFFPNSLPNG